MKIVADSSPFIQKFDTIDSGAKRKSGKKPTDKLSSKSMAKLASIVTRDYRCGLGAAFTGRPVPVPPRDSAYAQLKLESLRNDLTQLRGQWMAGSCIHRYLGEVLQRLPVPLPLMPLTPTPSFDIPRVSPVLPSQLKPAAVIDPPVDYGVSFAPGSKETDGGAPVRRLVVLGDGASSRSEFRQPTSEEKLRMFEIEMQYTLDETRQAVAEGRAPEQSGFSRADLIQFWQAALDHIPTLSTLQKSQHGRKLLNQACHALQHSLEHVQSRKGTEWSEKLPKAALPAVEPPSATELLRVIEARNAGVAVTTPE